MSDSDTPVTASLPTALMLDVVANIVSLNGLQHFVILTSQKQQSFVVSDDVIFRRQSWC